MGALTQNNQLLDAIKTVRSALIDDNTTNFYENCKEAISMCIKDAFDSTGGIDVDEIANIAADSIIRSLIK